MCLSRVAFCVDVHRMIKQPCVCLCPALLSVTLTTLLTVLCNWEEKMEVEKVGRGHWRAHRSALYEWGRGVKCGVMSMIDVDFWHQKVEGEAHTFSHFHFCFSFNLDGEKTKDISSLSNTGTWGRKCVNRKNTPLKPFVYNELFHS